MNKLTQCALESLRADQSGRPVRDGGNLNGLVYAKADGTVSVHFYYQYRRCRQGGKFTDISCGTWPAHSLACIRDRRDTARQQLKNKRDPAVQKKIDARDSN